MKKKIVVFIIILLSFSLIMTACSTTDEFNVTFDTDGGSLISRQLIESGKKVTEPIENPTKIGYTFDGWYKDSSFADPYVFTIETITSDTTIYVKWTPNTYTIALDTAGGTVSPSSYIVTYDSAYTLAIPTIADCVFGGWYSAPNGGGTQYTNADGTSISNWTHNADRMLYAKWTRTYTITCDADGGTVSSSTGVVIFDASYTLAIPTRTGYTFDGWYSEKNGSGTQYTNADGTSISNWTHYADKTLYAKWTVNTYTVTCDADGGTVSPSSYIVTYDSAYTLAIPTRTGYTFDGWYSAPNGGGTQYTNADGTSISNWTHNADRMLYAKWTAQQFSITYDPDGGEALIPSTGLVTYNASYTLAIPVYAGYTFDGWYSEKNGSGTQYTNADGTSISNWTHYADKTLYAKWTVNTYTVTYDADGGTVLPSSYVVTYNTSYTLTVSTRVGYTFDGWYSEANGGGTQYTNADGTSISNWTETAGRILLAKWTANTYTITYDAQGGTVLPSTCVVTYDSNYTLAIPTRTGYGFGGWYSEKNGSGTQYTDAGTSRANWTETAGRTLFAKWTANQYSITYDPDGGEPLVPPTGLAYYDRSYTLAIPTRVGYTFGGWYSEKNGGGTQYTNADGKSISNWTIAAFQTIVYAKWILISTYTITYDARGGTVSQATYVVNVNAGYILAIPTLTNYNFGGWYSEINGGGTQYTNANGTSISNWTETANRTLYAYWQGTTGLNYTSYFGTYYSVSKGTANTGGNVVIQKYVLGKPVTVIADDAFKGCTTLTSIIIPDSVTSIGASAFSNTGFTSITIPNSIAIIGASAFSNTPLASVTIPDSVTRIGTSAFSNTSIWNNAANNNLVIADRWVVGYKGTIGTSINNLDLKLIGVSDSAFKNNTSITSIDLANIRYLGAYAFEGCTLLQYIHMPKVTSVGYYCFSNCTKISDIVIPVSVTKMAEGAFYGWKNTQTIHFKASLNTINDYELSGNWGNIMAGNFANLHFDCTHL